MIPVTAGEADSKKTRTVKSEKAPIPRIAIINLQKLMQASTAAQSLKKQVENVATKAQWKRSGKRSKNTVTDLAKGKGNAQSLPPPPPSLPHTAAPAPRQRRSPEAW